MRLDPTGIRLHPDTTVRVPAADPIPAPYAEQHTPACACHHQHTAPAPVAARPTVQLTAGSTLALIAGGAGAVLVVGTVLVSMLLAVAVTAMSVAVCAVVLRSLLNQHTKR
jgi:hypothetical protein